MQPQEALEKFQDLLSAREKGEILETSFVYYAGQDAKNLKRRVNVGFDFNGGYDDDQGFYHAVKGDHIAFRYEIRNSLGSGACGQVIKAYDHKHNRLVAIKIIRNIPLFKELAQQEISISQRLSKSSSRDGSQQCVVNLLNHFIFRDHPCMVFELLGATLYELMQSNQFQGLSEEVVREFCVEMLRSLAMLRQNKIVHCDIKPQNILLFNRNCNCNHLTNLADTKTTCSISSSGDSQDAAATGSKTTKSCGAPEAILKDEFCHPPDVIENLLKLGMHHLKLIDFGCSSMGGHCRFMYIQSRWYRAPEVILGVGYNFPIDMWSFACVAAELVTGQPLFPGENELDQLALIMEVIGFPSEQLLGKSRKRAGFFDPDSGVPLFCTTATSEAGYDVITGGTSPSGQPRGLPGTKNLTDLLGDCVSDKFADFLSACLQWEPEKRLTPQAALEHDWITERHARIMRKRSFTT